jgi:hypothetical protein
MGEATSFRKLSVLMPVYNERWTLESIVRRVLTSPVSLDIELVLVDDCSRDGSWELAQRLAAADSRIVAVRHERNGGKGTAIRTAIGHMTGDIAVVQDADLEYDPHEFPALVQPILDGQADAVFGSRYASPARRVPHFWHTQVNRFLTLMSNLLTGLTLTDMETCYKVVRADVLRQLRLKSATFTLEPELTSRLAQWGARIYEAPISYAGRSFAEGKKIRPIDGLKAIGEMLRCRFVDRHFSDHHAFEALKACDRATRLQRWIAERAQPHFGERVLQIGSGIGSLSGYLLTKERVILAESDSVCESALRHRFARRDNLTIDAGSINNVFDVERWRREKIDTILLADWLGHRASQHTIEACANLLPEEGRLVLFAPSDSDDPESSSLFSRLHHAGLQVTSHDEVGRLPRWLAARFDSAEPLAVASRLRWLNRWLPLARLVDRASGGCPLAHLVVAQKRAAAALRVAA